MNDRERVAENRRRIKFSHVLIALLLVGIAAFAVFRINTRFKLRARIDAVRAAGYPVTCAELDRWYAIPPDVENAAYTMEEAFLFLNSWDKEKSRALPVVGRAELPPRTEPLPADMRTVMAEYVADNNEALELLHTGAAIEDCRYAVDLTLGMGTLMPNLSEMRGSVFLLKLEAILHADAGDGESAKRSAITCFGIARTLEGLPTTIAQLVRSACQAIAVSTVEQIVNRTELTDEQLAEFVRCVREGERMCGLSEALIGERCMGMTFFKNPQGVDPDLVGGIPLGPLVALYKAAGLADSDAAIYLDLMDGYLKSSQLPPHERQEAADAVGDRLRSTSKAHVLLHTIMPALSRVTTIELRTIARLRAADAAIAVLRYRLATGKLPDKLADLVPAYLENIPKDPFDGNKLRYKKLDPGFIVYSIGEDLSDDGGKEKPSKTAKGGKPVNWDVTFIVER